MNKEFYDRVAELLTEMNRFAESQNAINETTGKHIKLLQDEIEKLKAKDRPPQSA